MEMALEGAIASAAGQDIFVGGKSMGGRVASMIAEPAFVGRRISGCICLGYPFHPPKEKEKRRVTHLQDITCPVLVVQGERDKFGDVSDVQEYDLSRSIEFFWIEDGDHDLRSRVRSGRPYQHNLEEAALAMADFIRRHHRIEAV